MRLGRRLLLILSVAAASVTGVGCGTGPEPLAPETVTLAVRADVTGFFPNPPIANESYTYDINWQIFEGLVGFDAALRPRPTLATSWENPDDRTYVFHLRPGIRFSDGRPLTAADAAASLEAAGRRGWITRDYLQAVESARADGPLRLEIRTRLPYPVLLSKLPWGLILPADAVQQTPAPVVGTGPYALESWQPGREFTLVRNRFYRGPPAAFARARFVVVPDDAERVARLLRGEADVADNVPLAQADALRRRSDVAVFSGSGLRVMFLGLRVDEPPFSDPRVREAIDLSIDRVELIRRAYGGGTVPAYQIVPPAVVGHDPKLPVTPLDRSRARALLAAAGHPEGFAIRLDGSHNRYVNDRQILQEVSRQLAEVGIRVEVNALSKEQLFPLVFGGGSRFHLLGYECQSGEAGQVLDTVLHSRGEAGFGSTNSTGLADAELDRLIGASNVSENLQKRTWALQRALARVAELRPVIPLLVQVETVAASRRIRWKPGLTYALRVADMEPAGETAP